MKRNMRIWSMLLTLVMVLSVAIPANAQENISANSQTNVEDSEEGNQGDTGRRPPTGRAAAPVKRQPLPFSDK